MQCAVFSGAKKTEHGAKAWTFSAVENPARQIWVSTSFETDLRFESAYFAFSQALLWTARARFAHQQYSPDATYQPGQGEYLTDLCFMIHPQRSRQAGCEVTWEEKVILSREKRPIDGLKGGFHRSDTIKWPRRSALTCLGCPFNYIPEICWICIAIGYALKKVPWPIKLVVLYTHASLDHSTSTGCIYFMRLLLWPYDIWDTDTHIYRTGWPTGRVWETGSDANLLWASRGVPYKSTVEKCHTNLLWRADVSL